MKYRKLRIAWSVAWGLLAALLIAICGWMYGKFGIFPIGTPELTILGIIVAILLWGGTPRPPLFGKEYKK